MFENSGTLKPLNWQGLVEETLRRRKAEGLTQKEHSALAGVSHPTMAAFERGETTLTLAKAFDILRVVGLIDEPAPGDRQQIFVREAFQRWRQLTSDLPQDSPARFPDGYFQLDYWLEGDIKTQELEVFFGALRDAVVRKTGWPMFSVPPFSEDEVGEIDGQVECWLARNPRFANDVAAHCDFWRASPEGRLFLMRGYQEDGSETLPPRTIFDTTLPIWRLGEALLHAQKLAQLLRKHQTDEVIVHLRATYNGLLGRVLRSWANPMSDLRVESRGSTSDEVVLQTDFRADSIAGNLAEYLLPMISSLYERFGITTVTIENVDFEVQRMLNSTASRR